MTAMLMNLTIPEVLLNFTSCSGFSHSRDGFPNPEAFIARPLRLEKNLNGDGSVFVEFYQHNAMCNPLYQLK